MANNVCSIGDSYVPASFNGVPFYCIEASSEHGRRGAEGEFPFGENTAYADLGRRIRTYSLSAIFREDNHVLLAAALIAACELPGPGILVHPTRGVVNAACKSIKVSDKIEEEAGVTYVDMEFVEGNAWPNGLSLVGTALGLVFGTLIDTSKASFHSRYKPHTISPVRRQQAVQVLQDSVGQIADRYSQAIQNQKDSRKFRALSDLRAVQVEDVIAANTDIAEKAITLGSNALASELVGEDKFSSFKGLANWAAKPITMPYQAGEAQDAVYSHTRIMSAIFMAQAAAETDYARTFQALSDLDSLTTILDDEAQHAYNRCDNDLYLAIVDMKTKTQAILYEKAYNLPRLVEYDFYSGVHPLVAAYAIYGDSKRHRDLELRNFVDANGRFKPTIVGAES